MTKFIRRVVVAVVIGIVGNAGLSPVSAQAPTGTDPLQQCHRVHCEVGLLVRASGSSKGKKIGKLEDGTKVQLAGESLPGTGAVYPQIQKEKDGSYWIKIKSPMTGYVLYTADDDLTFKYIVPCKE